MSEISREKLIRAYISALVWSFGVVTDKYIAEVFNIYEEEKTTLEEVVTVGMKFAEEGDVFAKRRELFVSAYAFDGWRFSEITAFAEKMPKERRTLSHEEIMLYYERSFEPTFPAKERLHKFLEISLGDKAPIALNHMEKECRLGRLTTSSAAEIFALYSGNKPLNKSKFDNYIMGFIRDCTHWAGVD
jgi:hypothetical protein